MSKVAIIGRGYLGTAYNGMFPDAVVYDEPKGIGTKDEVNACDIAIICVPTDPLPNGALDMSVVESVVDWVETPLILIKSALMPGTTDRLIEKTGKKIAVSPEYIGMGNYYQPPHKYPDATDPAKHGFLVVGGDTDTAAACANFLWAKMSPDIKIHLVSAVEAEIVKLLENAYFGLKLTWVNCIYSLVTKSDASFIKVHQAWTADGRVDSMHQRTMPGKRGWQSHCLTKDIPALAGFAHDVGADDMADLLSLVVKLNEGHLKENDQI